MNDFGPDFVSVGDLETNVDKNLESDSGEKGFVFKDRLEFRDVKFSYPGKEPVLDGISFAVKKRGARRRCWVFGIRQDDSSRLIYALFLSSIWRNYFGWS